MLVLAEEERDLRVAHVLAAHPGIERIAVMGDVRSATHERVEDPTGFDVIVGRTAGAVDVAARAGAGAVTAAQVTASPVPTVAGASLLGWALALAARLESNGADVIRVAIAHPGGPSTGTHPVRFPPPVGRLRGTVCQDDPFQVVVAQTRETWGTALVEANTGEQALVDDFNFLWPICLAAGVALVPPAGVLGVWDAASIYLAQAEEMGLVAAAKNRS